VRPAAGHWEKYIPNPALHPDRVNLIHLTPFGRSTPKAAVDRQHGWGQRLMRFDRMSADWSGVGVKVGIIDSGCDVAHPILRHIDRGVDLTRDHDPHSWHTDELGQGTHCAGIIAGAATPTAEAVGCAPGAEVWVLKVVPGGHCSDLIEALDVCIEQRLDVVQIGVSCDRFSELVTQKIAAAQLHGVACISGSGNSGGHVQFPANIPGILAVAAIGKLGEFPQDTRHAQRALAHSPTSGGLFATYFSSSGPQVAVCAPGVAVISSVPGGGYAAWDGSTLAASHVTGMAALLLSHHPALQRTDHVARPDTRISLLYALIRAAALPLVQWEPTRVGAGLPDLERVPSLQPAAWGMPVSFPLHHPMAAGPLRAAGGWG
jgi:subtilisin family serine protease